MRHVAVFGLISCAFNFPLDSSGAEKKAYSPHHPEIPSLPLLSRQEHSAISDLIQLIVLDDIGKGPKGPRAISGKQSRQMFEKLGPESMPLMIQAMNHATEQSWTCPATILATKLARVIEKAGERSDLDFLEYAYANLGVTTKNPLEQFTSLKNFTNGRISSVKKETGHAFKIMELNALVEKSNAYEKRPSTKQASWRWMISTIPDRKDKAACFELLFDAMDNSRTPMERKTIHAVLVKMAGVDHGPREFDGAGAARSAVFRWREWRKEQKAKP